MKIQKLKGFAALAVVLLLGGCSGVGAVSASDPYKVSGQSVASLFDVRVKQMLNAPSDLKSLKSILAQMYDCTWRTMPGDDDLNQVCLLESKVALSPAIMDFDTTLTREAQDDLLAKLESGDATDPIAKTHSRVLGASGMLLYPKKITADLLATYDIDELDVTLYSTDARSVSHTK